LLFGEWEFSLRIAGRLAGALKVWRNAFLSALGCPRQPKTMPMADHRMLADFMGPIRGAAWIRRYFLMVDVQWLSRKSGLLVTFTTMSELRDCMVPRLPKQNRQIEEEPRKIPIRSRGKRACGASASLERNLRAHDR